MSLWRGVQSSSQLFLILLHCCAAFCVRICVAGQGGSVALTHACHSALSASVHKHFSGPNVIHCMCHDGAIVMQLPQHYDGGVRPVIRGSDDFYPRDKASHGAHIYANAYNSLLLAHCGGLQVQLSTHD